MICFENGSSRLAFAYSMKRSNSISLVSLATVCLMVASWRGVQKADGEMCAIWFMSASADGERDASGLKVAAGDGRHLGFQSRQRCGALLDGLQLRNGVQGLLALAQRF